MTVNTGTRDGEQMSAAHAIIDALPDRIRGRRTSPWYALGLLTVMLLMVSLVLMYVAVMLALAAGTVYYAIYFLPFQHQKSGAMVQITMYSAPLIAGSLMAVTMARPLFVPPLQPPPLKTLRPTEEPALFAFIAKIAKSMGAPMPARIDVDLSANASASFQHGLRGLRRNELVLTLGLPLLYGFSVNNLAGVIAHEFGHFTQGLGMRLTFLIHSIYLWLASLAYGDEDWYDAINRWGEQVPGIVAGIVGWGFALLYICIFITRLIARGLLFLATLFSSHLLRQMEYDADAYEIELVGTECFKNTFYRILLMDVSTLEVNERIVPTWQNARKRIEDIPLSVYQEARNMPPDLRDRVKQHIAEAKTGYWDSHPSAAARIRRTERDLQAGTFTRSEGAHVLLSDIQTLSRRVTGEMYDRYSPELDAAAREKQLSSHLA